MRARFITAYFLNLFDLIAMLALVKLYGVGVEVNPLMSRIIGDFWAVLGVKFVGIGLLMFLIYKLRRWAFKLSNAASWICFAAYSLLAVYHSIIFVTILT